MVESPWEKEGVGDSGNDVEYGSQGWGLRPDVGLMVCEDGFSDEYVG